MEKRQSGLGVPRFFLRLWVDPPDKIWADFVDDTDEPIFILGQLAFLGYRLRFAKALLT